MKKAFTTLAVMVFCFSLFAATFNFGGGIAVNGDSRARSSFELNFIYRPLALNYANPYARVEAGAGLGRGGFALNALKVNLGLELFRSMANPLAFTTVNKGPWSPAVSGGLATDFVRTDWYAEVSLFRVLDKDYIYEWFPVFGVFDAGGLRYWGVCFFRLTSMF